MSEEPNVKVCAASASLNIGYTGTDLSTKAGYPKISQKKKLPKTYYLKPTT